YSSSQPMMSKLFPSSIPTIIKGWLRAADFHSCTVIKKAVSAETDSSILATRLKLSAEERNCDISIEISDGKPDSVLDLLSSMYIGTVHFSFRVYPSCDSWS